MAGLRYTISLDVHKRDTQACIANDAGDILVEKRFRTTKKSYGRALKKYKTGDVIIESVGFYRPVAKWLQDLGYDVHLAHLGAVKKDRRKSDKRDAKRNLRLYQGKALAEAYLPPEEVHRLRDIARHRMFIGKELRRLKSKVKQDLYKLGHFVEENPLDNEKGREWLSTLDFPEIQSLLRLWKPLREEMKIAEERIAATTTDLSEARILMTVPGVGAYMALLILAEVGDFHRFPSGDSLAAYAGLVPSQHQSGDHDRHGSITKEGNPYLRWAMVEVIKNHVRVCPESDISKRHERLAEKKGYSKATVAAARQLCTVLHVMVTRKEEFKVNPRNPS